MTRALALLALCGCWVARGSQVYPVRDHVRVRAIGDRTGWLVDSHHWITAANGDLAIVDEAIDAGPPMPLGFVDRPLRITVELYAGDPVWVPWVDADGRRHVTHTHASTMHALAAALPQRAFGAPILHECPDAFACSAGEDAVVGVVVGWTPDQRTQIATLPELVSYVSAHDELRPYWNKQSVDAAIAPEWTPGAAPAPDTEGGP